MRFGSTRLLSGTLIAMMGLLLIPGSGGCRSDGKAGAACSRTSPTVRKASASKAVIRRVVCLYDQRPWLNLDTEADRTPEGIRYRAFLDPGTGRGVLKDGTFHIELYEIVRVGPTQTDRRLISDWHYHAKDVHTIAHPGMLGNGYFLHLRWANKSIAGKEVELITAFEDQDGNVSRSSTKRLRVPKYDA